MAGRRSAGLARCALVALAVLATTLAGGLTAPPAAAQERVLRAQGLLDFLFRPPHRRERYIPPSERRYIDPPVQRRVGEPSREGATPRRTPRAAAPSAPREPPPPPVVEKAPDAKVVLVVGDFLAGGLAEGLIAAYAENPNIRVVDRTSGSSGFVRDDFYDWPGEIKAILEAEKPDAVAVMIGSNDRQQMVVDGTREEKRSDPWNKAYERRVAAFAGALRGHGKPFVWVGVPAFKSPAMSSDMLAFNDIFRKTAEEYGGAFVDIWDGFVDENGAFATTGPDINGQPVRLRASDGINLTRQGRRKVAFYAEKPLERLFDTAARPALAAPSAVPEGGPDAALERIDRTAPVSLSGPELDGGEELLGRTVPVGNARSTIADRMTVDGLGEQPVAGRADDFGGRRTAVRPAPGAGDTAPTSTNAISR